MRFVAAFLFIVSLAHSAAAQTVTDGRMWFTLGLQGRLAPESPWRWSLDTVARSRDGVDAVDSTQLRPMLMYTVTSHTSVGGGYVLVSSFPVTGGRTTEHRVFGSYAWTTAGGGGTITLRVRVEDRLIEANSGMLWRLRTYARYSHPVRPGSRLAVVGYDEFNVHANTTTRSPRGFDQNRTFAGISTSWSSRVRTEIGYTNQYIAGHGSANRMNHIVSGTLSLTL